MFVQTYVFGCLSMSCALYVINIDRLCRFFSRKTAVSGSKIVCFDELNKGDRNNYQNCNFSTDYKSQIINAIFS